MNTQPFNKFCTQLSQQKSETPIVFLGLGNPGKLQEHAKHNAGQLVLKNFQNCSHVYEDSLVSIYEYTNRICIAFSKTYMNDSKNAVQAVSKYMQCDYELVVVHDDLDLNIGEIKFKLQSTQTSAHGGLKSIVLIRPFCRIRVGIGSPERVKNVVAKYVLSKWTPGELAQFDDTVYKMIEKISERFVKREQSELYSMRV